MKMKFRPGRIVATPGALELLDKAGPNPFSATGIMSRHLTGDWGELCAEDKLANENALLNGERILSSYLVSGEKLWIITEWDRSVTTLLRPEEY